LEIPLADTDAWTIAEGKDRGKPSFIRYRPNLQSYVGDSRYPRRLVIIWEFDPQNNSGMPSEELNDNMRALEDAIDGALDPDRLAVLAFVYTKTGVREWHFYLEDVSEASLRINDALSKLPIYPISLQVEDDKNWDALCDVFKLVG